MAQGTFLRSWQTTALMDHHFPLCPGRLASFLVLEHNKFTSASGLLHMLVPLPGTLFTQVFTSPLPSHLLTLSSNILWEGSFPDDPI